MDKDLIKIQMGEDDCFDVIINNELEVHIKRNDIGYSVDLYKHKKQENMGGGYDFDGDFISGCVAYDDDLIDEDDDEALVTYLSVSIECEKGVYLHEWRYEDNNLYDDSDDLVSEDVTSMKEVIETIVDDYKDNDKVVLIENADTGKVYYEV